MDAVARSLFYPILVVLQTKLHLFDYFYIFITEYYNIFNYMFDTETRGNHGKTTTQREA